MRRARLLAPGLLVALAFVTPPAVASSTPLTLDGIRVNLPPGSRQVITVHHTSSYHARAILWAENARGRWKAIQQTSNARIGENGLVAGNQRHQGSDTTPTGTYRLPFGFGISAVKTRMPYRRVTAADWWVEDNASKYYNRFRTSRQGFRWWINPALVNSSEHLVDNPTQYALAIVIAYNYARPVHYRGAGIFLHVNGPGATAGCVSAPRWFLADVLQRLRPVDHPVIAIG